MPRFTLWILYKKYHKPHFDAPLETPTHDSLTAFIDGKARVPIPRQQEFSKTRNGAKNHAGNVRLVWVTIHTMMHVTSEQTTAKFNQGIG